ncbi:sugar ABC transporter substrate-binding protein [Symbioplanes lichenis]|uniref:sugar ABC transporter substrate-binding protein n=1 Tax=Symbioplanes lichenis TaxID=1629072 RepID=UPI00273859A4|nr:substrate-binding domain-containing protein [Actinoplanes lichenis]
MRTTLCALTAAGLLAAGAVSACTTADDDSGGAAPRARAGAPGTGKVGVILPDTTTSQRWGSDDPKLLQAAFDAEDVPVDIRNAQGDKEEFGRIADSMIESGARVLMIANLDSASGSAVLERARAAGVKTIDYDRLTLNGGADYYVSFDNEAVGRQQGDGLIRCLRERRIADPMVAYLNGSPTDNNATLFKKGYNEVIQPLFDDGKMLKGPDQDVDDWKEEAAVTIFQEMWTQTQGEIDGVLAANDTLGAAAIAELKKTKRNGFVPVTGQDATVQGLQNVLSGDQCMTVYKPIKQEADAAAKLAISLYQGVTAAAKDRVKDVESGAYVPAVLLQPRAIFKADVGSVIADGFVERDAVCTGRFAPLCEANGI